MTEARRKLIRMMALSNQQLLSEIEIAAFSADEKKMYVMIQELHKLIIELTEPTEPKTRADADITLRHKLAAKLEAGQDSEDDRVDGIIDAMMEFRNS